MEIGEELRIWLDDKSKTYTARLEFAIKVWQSLDFVYINKHEVVCKWIADTLVEEEEMPVEQLQQLFCLRAQPGLVTVATKSALIEAVLKRIDKAPPAQAKGHPQLLKCLLNFELVQDALRADYDLVMRSYGILFSCYERQLLIDNEDEPKPRHADFILPVLQQLRDYVQRAQNNDRLLKAYVNGALHPLCQLLLELRKHGFCCFEQLAALEVHLTQHLRIRAAIKLMDEQPLHVQLLTLECALVNHRYDTDKLYKVLDHIFKFKAPQKADSGESRKAQPKATPKDNFIALVLTTHALEALRRHNIQLNFPDKLKKTGIAYMANALCDFVRINRERHLGRVLQMLCAALRLNPMLVEPHIYQLTIWMMCAVKRNEVELQLYSEYLVLLLDMCRRLSRTERFIMILLKSLREWLHNYELPNFETGKRIRQEPKPEPDQEPLTEQEEEQLMNAYVQLLLKSNSTSSCQSNAISYSTDALVQTWPGSTAGAAFIRLVSQLMSKPSIVIWKSLLHSFAELLEPDSMAVLPCNLNFAIELQATLLSQYFLGTRLAEHLQQHHVELEQQRKHTMQVLQRFGQYLLSLEHNRRTMNVFLECVERANNFDLLLAYYWPDGLEQPQSTPALPQLQRFLSSDEWELIHQRVHNFGKSLCRQRLQRLELQLTLSGWLLLPDQRLAPCPDALVELLPQQLFGHLTRAQKEMRLKQQQQQKQHLPNLLEDAECVELLTMQLLQQFVDSLKLAKIKGCLLAKQMPQATDETALGVTLRDSCESTKQPALPAESTQELIDALQQLPLAQLQSSLKLRLWLLLLTLYQDVRRAQLLQLSNQLLEQLIDLLHFGQPLPLCSHLPQLAQLLQLVPLNMDADDAADGNGTEAEATANATAWRFYEMFFARCIRRLTPGSDLFLASSAALFREQLPELSASHCRLLLLAIETLASGTGMQARRMQRHLQPLLEIYGQLVSHKFRSQKKSPAVYKEFVQQTLSGYAIYLSSCINRAAKQQKENVDEDKQQKESIDEAKQQKENVKKTKQEPKQAIAVPVIDENFRRICKIYIGHSLNYRNAHAIRLLNVALTHRQLLHLDQDEIEFVLDSYWRQLNKDIAASSALDMASIEPAIKLIIGYKTNEDFLLLLRGLGQQLDEMQRPETPAQHTSLQNVLVLMTLFAKCSLSSIKGAMLNEQFKLINGNVSLRLPAPSDAAYCNHVLRLLEAQSALANNRTVPLNGETLDSILASMLDLNIKRFILAGGSWLDFRRLHATLSENCLLLLRQHAALMADRAAQLSAICQDLVQSIVCYRSERQQAQSLTEDELEGLAELGLKLSTLMAGISAGLALAMKRVAPFLLIFTIKQMIDTERPTTLFEKIKLQVDRFCHELISICDHRSGHFILRSSSEAGARMYQSLVKEHDKYHKFRGKV
ncbi:PREDICTED: uncharacterized protein LOC108619589 isoform X1 [Drosophila arizonae]|uniref:Uncharacterized protein LOC108619589 isoform X1 n=1 Tax=Drosophila arizonae TaxID=7263 RepID=A0ABM1PX09_DROAR|nr:PREDICTED: uncharacterized protein LOC108619589 isoform X1 [Drosophila arizonae]